MRQTLKSNERQKSHTTHDTLLNCTLYGGPSIEFAREMVYWSTIPTDHDYSSPFFNASGDEQYVTFEPDDAGFNNQRMIFETIFTMAVAMGRTLVLPASDPNELRFQDVYNFVAIMRQWKGVRVITMEQFLDEMGMAGKLKNENGQVLYPPGNWTDWSSGDEDDMLRSYLRAVSYWPDWEPYDCMAAFPASQRQEDLQIMANLKNKIDRDEEWRAKYGASDSYSLFINNPIPVNATVEDRVKEVWAERNKLCLYNEEMQKAPLVHFGVEYKGQDDDVAVRGGRLLAQWYSFLLFQDWKKDLFMKRFVRDALRYRDEIQCAAAAIIAAIRDRARKRDPANTNGDYDAFHVRRGDFETDFEGTTVTAERIYSISKNKLTPNATVYIATNEDNMSFFRPLADHYDVVFLSDFQDVIPDIDDAFFGMIEQLVASRSRVFFGCWLSTFTSYIMRLRGYHSVTREELGYKDGVLPSSYHYVFEKNKYHMHDYYPVKQYFYATEFPAAWRDIDASVGKSMDAS